MPHRQFVDITDERVAPYAPATGRLAQDLRNNVDSIVVYPLVPQVFDLSVVSQFRPFGGDGDNFDPYALAVISVFVPDAAVGNAGTRLVMNVFGALDRISGGAAHDECLLWLNLDPPPTANYFDNIGQAKIVAYHDDTPIFSTQRLQVDFTPTGNTVSQVAIVTWSGSNPVGSDWDVYAQWPRVEGTFPEGEAGVPVPLTDTGTYGYLERID